MGEARSSTTWRFDSETKPRDFFPILNLAQNMFKAGASEDAYALFTKLFTLFPAKAAKNSTAVTSTAKLEKQRGVATSVLPKDAKPNRDRLVAGLLIGGSVAAFPIVSFGLRLSQPLYLSNPLPVPVEVVVDGETRQVPPQGFERLYVAEGQYDVEIRLPSETLELSIDVENSIMERFSRDNAFVVSVLGAEFLAVEELYYSDRPTNPDPDVKVVAGESFYAFRDIDFAFEDPPETIESKGPATRVVLYRVGESPVEALQFFSENTFLFRKLDLLGVSRAQIRGGNTNPDFVGLYMRLASEAGDAADAKAFLNERGVPVPVLEAGEPSGDDQP